MFYIGRVCRRADNVSHICVYSSHIFYIFSSAFLRNNFSPLSLYFSFSFSSFPFLFHREMPMPSKIVKRIEFYVTVVCRVSQFNAPLTFHMLFILIFRFEFYIKCRGYLNVVNLLLLSPEICYMSSS